MNGIFLKLLHRRIANTSIGPSTARGMGPKGTIKAARDFLRQLDLCRFRTRNRNSFRKMLDEFTNEFRMALPRGARYWGSARKFLNIFLRSIVYNRYLCEENHLRHIEPWLEIPLDSHVAKGLRLENGGDELPRWHTVVGLTPAMNKIYQDIAQKVANSKGTLRVHLDLLYWRGDHLIKRNGATTGRRPAGR